MHTLCARARYINNEKWKFWNCNLTIQVDWHNLFACFTKVIMILLIKHLFLTCGFQRSLNSLKGSACHISSVIVILQSYVIKMSISKLITVNYNKKNFNVSFWLMLLYRVLVLKEKISWKSLVTTFLTGFSKMSTFLSSTCCIFHVGKWRL